MIINNVHRIMILIILLLLIFFVHLPADVYAQPYTVSGYTCLLDADTGQVISSNNADERRPVASTTKIMTAVLTVEYADLDEIAVISQKADKTPEYTIGLIEGQEVSIAELLKAALLRSSNDAAAALAEHVAGNERFFGYLMSKKAFLLGAENTYFTNASGLPDEEHVSTAYDLTIMGRYLLSKEYINQLVAAKTIEFKHPGYNEKLIISNTNALLGSYAGANGIKTGTTNAAGKCLVASASRDGRQLVCAALNSGDRNGDCTRMLNYGFNGVTLDKVVDSSMAFKEIKIYNGSKDYLEVYPDEDLCLWIGEDNPEVKKRVKMNYKPEPPIETGQELGVLQVYADGKLIKSIKLISKENLDKQSRWIRPLKEFFTS